MLSSFAQPKLAMATRGKAKANCRILGTVVPRIGQVIGEIEVMEASSVWLQGRPEGLRSHSSGCAVGLLDGARLFNGDCVATPSGSVGCNFK